jgi:hypothetical protein
MEEVVKVVNFVRVTSFNSSLVSYRPMFSDIRSVYLHFLYHPDPQALKFSNSMWILELADVSDTCDDINKLNVHCKDRNVAGIRQKVQDTSTSKWFSCSLNTFGTLHHAD